MKSIDPTGLFSALTIWNRPDMSADVGVYLHADNSPTLLLVLNHVLALPSDKCFSAHKGDEIKLSKDGWNTEKFWLTLQYAGIEEYNFP